MASAPIDFGPKQRSGDHELGGASPVAMNVIVDGAGVVRRRPGIQAYSAAPVGAVDASGVSLLHETADGTLFAVDNDPLAKGVYVIAGGVATDISAISGDRIVGARRPTIAETEAMVVFAGGGDALKALLSNTVQLSSGVLAPAHPHIKAGAIRALAVTGSKRWHDLPDIPTMEEAGFKDFVFETYTAVLAPAKTPPEIVARLEKEMLAILRKPEMRTKLEQSGFEVQAKDGKAHMQRVAKEVPLFRDIMAQAGIKKLQ